MWWAALAALVAIVVIGGGVAAWVVTHSPAPTAPVPSLRGDTEAQAAAALGQRHLSMTVAGRAYDTKAPAGTVTAQVPATGRLRQHRPVGITLSLGPRPIEVPAGLAGLARAQAVSRVTAAGLRPGRMRQQSSLTVPKGRVIAASPASGRLLPGTPIALVISTGRPHVAVPRLTGNDLKSYAAVAAALGRSHLVPHEHLNFNAMTPGTVLGIVPRSGSSVVYGSGVTVDVSKGYRHPGRHRAPG